MGYAHRDFAAAAAANRAGWGILRAARTLFLEHGYFGIPMRIHELWCFYNMLADAYRWRPLFTEQDWEETMAPICRNVFPEETQQRYGKECWYGDAGTSPPPHANSPSRPLSPSAAPRRQ